MKEIFDCLEIHSKIPHEEYESVKLYGESSFIIDALKYAITEYSDITIASIDIIILIPIKSIQRNLDSNQVRLITCLWHIHMWIIVA